MRQVSASWVGCMRTDSEILSETTRLPPRFIALLLTRAMRQRCIGWVDFLSLERVSWPKMTQWLPVISEARRSRGTRLRR